MFNKYVNINFMQKSSFFKLVSSSWRFQWYLLLKLPAAWFMGIQVKACNEEKCTVRLPFRWQTQNPFRSIYFAAQCAAAELSTGLLLMGAIQGGPQVSMLIVGMEAEFIKKASATLLFICEDGALAAQAVRQALESGEPQRIEMISAGTLPDGVVAARIKVVWSIKRK